jgi:hypothetical protein
MCVAAAIEFVIGTGVIVIVGGIAIIDTGEKSQLSSSDFFLGSASRLGGWPFLAAAADKMRRSGDPT